MIGFVQFYHFNFLWGVECKGFKIKDTIRIGTNLFN